MRALVVAGCVVAPAGASGAIDRGRAHDQRVGLPEGPPFPEALENTSTDPVLGPPLPEGDTPPAPADQPPAAHPTDQPAALPTDPPADPPATNAPPSDAEPAEPTGLSALLHGWDGRVELGLNGSGGNSDAASLRFRINGKRREGRHETNASLTYRVATRSGRTTQNRLDIQLRHDWKSEDNERWRVFGNARTEWDEFQGYDLRVSGFIGLGYDVLRDGDLTLVGRVGLGGTQDFGGAQDGFRPEGILGLESTYTISERQRLTGEAEAVPDFESSEYRLQLEGAWEIVLDRDSNLSLRIGGDVRFDSGASPGFETTDTSYFLTLGWSY